MELTEQFEWQGRSIACARAGTGPDVVFCHGTPFSSIEWDDYAEAMSADHTVHVWDMPGYGRSSKDSDLPVDFATQAAAFAALLQHWQLTRPHVVAHDYGGATSLGARLFEGASYASLTLIDVVAIPPSGSPFFRFVQANPTTLVDLPAYIHDAVLRAYISGASATGLREEELDAYVEPWTGDVGQAAFYRQIAAYDESYLARIEQNLDRLGTPTQILWGAEDAWVPPQTGRRLAGLIPDAQYQEIAGGGHLLAHDAPVAVSTAVARWIARHGG